MTVEPAEREATVEVNQDSSFAYFLFPFSFEPSEFDSRSEAIEAHVVRGAKRDLPVWTPVEFLSDDLLAHIARNLDRGSGNSVAARGWRLSPEADRSFGLGQGWHWTFSYPKGEVPFNWTSGKRFSVELILFRIGIGFLAYQPNPLTAVWADWCDFLHYFRFIDRHGVTIRATSKSKPSGPGSTSAEEPMWPDPTGGRERHPDGEGTLEEIQQTLLSTASFDEDNAPWWGAVFVPGQLMPYACLYIDNAQGMDRSDTLYRARNFFHSRMDVHPVSAGVSIEGASLLQYAEDQWFTFSLEGGTFVAFDAPRTPFFLETMPDHVGNQYFLLFLLALHQRFALMMLSFRVAETWVDSPDRCVDSSLTSRTSAFTDILDELLSFTARGYFKQVMQGDHHHRCYLKWQETFQIDLLFREVTDEVRTMHDYLMTCADEQRAILEKEQSRQAAIAEQRSRRLEKLLNLFAWIIGVPAFATFVLSAARGVSKLATLYWVLGALLLGILLYLLFTQLVWRSHTSKEEGKAGLEDVKLKMPSLPGPIELHPKNNTETEHADMNDIE